jgi:hypothetical protein
MVQSQGDLLRMAVPRRAGEVVGMVQHSRHSVEFDAQAALEAIEGQRT